MSRIDLAEPWIVRDMRKRVKESGYDHGMTEWFPLPGYETYYEVSTAGVRSKDRIDSLGRHRKGKKLTPYIDTTGRAVLSIYVNGKCKKMFEHTAVALHFLGSRPEGREICHRDGNPLNNHPDNLYYGTRSDNIQDAVRHGTHSSVAKSRCPRGHLLQEPNLVRSKLAKGLRNCLSCHRGHSRLKHRPDSTLQECADHFYELLEIEGVDHG